MASLWCNNDPFTIPMLAQAKQIISKRRGNECLFDLNLPSADTAAWWSEQYDRFREGSENLKCHFGMKNLPQYGPLAGNPPTVHEKHPLQDGGNNGGITTLARNLLILPNAVGALKLKNYHGASKNEPKPNPKPKPQPQPVDTGYGARTA